MNGNWDTTTLNWFNGTSITAFHTGDNVTFDNTAGGFNVTITASVAPASVVVNSSGVNNYTFIGGGWHLPATAG